ncbi:MAG: Hpt domain-containing protein [Alphaproteobacteria bacterium]
MAGDIGNGRPDGFDEEMLRELAGLMGPDGIAAALDTFDADLRQGLSGLEAALAVRDGDALRRHAHRVKGLLMQFGAMAAGADAAAVESAHGDAAFESCPRLLASAPAAASRLRAMAARLASPG